MNVFIVILSFLTALLPIADRGMQHYRQAQQGRQEPAQLIQAVMKPVLPPTPPEAGQPGVVFHNGEWWKNVNGQWLVWRQHTQVAQGGAHVLR